MTRHGFVLLLTYKLYSPNLWRGSERERAKERLNERKMIALQQTTIELCQSHFIFIAWFDLVRSNWAPSSDTGTNNCHFSYSLSSSHHVFVCAVQLLFADRCGTKIYNTEENCTADKLNCQGGTIDRTVSIYCDWLTRVHTWYCLFMRQKWAYARKSSRS